MRLPQAPRSPPENSSRAPRAMLACFLKRHMKTNLLTRRFTDLVLLLIAFALCGGCTPIASPATSTPQSSGQAPRRDSAVSSDSTPLSPDDARSALPVYDEDIRWGSNTAPVTIVAFIDLQCPFCARGWQVLDSLEKRYGPQNLRVVVKHYPLPFHRYALVGALSTITVQRALGSDAALGFITTVFGHQQELSETRLRDWMGELGVTVAKTSALSPPQQIARDMALVESAGVTGTPCFFVNGVRISGAQPEEQFTSVIDAELTAVAAARKSGSGAHYADRVSVNFSKPAVVDDADAQAVEDLQVWKIPVGKSPTLGPSDALVTIVEFADYQCPYCKRAHETLKQVLQRYGKDVRLVFKHNPLPFHERARPAAQLAIEAHTEQGADAFWKATDALFGTEDLSDAHLLAIAEQLHLNSGKVKRALEKNTHDEVIEQDQDLADAFEARGTPHFFINGRRLEGAQPLEKFAALIDEQLEIAREIVAKGTPRAGVYAKIISVAKDAPPPDTVDLGAAPENRPSLGPANAPVTIRVFSDFQCPFCNRVRPTLNALRSEFQKDLRIVFYNLPLPFHQRARAAANAALEARAQRGDDGFWKIYDLIFDAQADLSDEKLGEHAKTLGINPDTVVNAVHAGSHDAIINEDSALAEHAGIHGTPSFSINGYFVSGAQPLQTFRRLVRRALEERRRTAHPKPTSGAAK